MLQFQHNLLNKANTSIIENEFNKLAVYVVEREKMKKSSEKNLSSLQMLVNCCKTIIK